MSRYGSPSGQKRRFLFYGAINVVLTNILLQLLLLQSSTIEATFLSQLFNVGLGFFFYSKKVFLVQQLKKRYALNYGLLALSLWFLNWHLIEVISGNWLVSRNISALILIPLLATFSYLMQKWVRPVLRF